MNSDGCQWLLTVADPSGRMVLSVGLDGRIRHYDKQGRAHHPWPWRWRRIARDIGPVLEAAHAQEVAPGGE